MLDGVERLTSATCGSTGGDAPVNVNLRPNAWRSIVGCMLAVGGVSWPLSSQELKLALETELRRASAATAAVPREVGASLARLYAHGDSRLLWIADGKATSQARELLRVIEQVETRGLRAEDYAAGELAALIDS